MHKFDFSFIKESIPGNIIGLTDVITDLKSKEEFRKLQYVETFESLRMKSVIESVAGSNAIENIITTDDRIKEIVAGAEPVTHDEFEISGYKDALTYIHAEHDNIDVNEKLILSLHRMLQERTVPDEAGEYKRTDNVIMEYDTDGTRRVRFRPVEAERVEESMEQLLLAYYDARQDQEIPPLLLIPCFILDFLCIHPFRDGNGRISRLLTVLMMYQFGYDIEKYISVEGEINKYRENYYEALRSSSDKWHENENDYTPFIVFFLQTLYKCYKDLDEAFTDISLKKAKKSERVESILLNAFVPLSKKEIESKVPDISVKTVELVLSRMLKEGKIEKIGTFKNARYISKVE